MPQYTGAAACAFAKVSKTEQGRTFTSWRDMVRPPSAVGERCKVRDRGKYSVLSSASSKWSAA